MTHFTLQSHMVRGDLFKESGKWEYTVQIDMSGVDYEHWDISSQVIRAYKTTPESVRGVVDGVSHYWLVVLDPYMKNGFPIMVWLE